jgi:DNA excision repair protein ERCC-5
MGVTGLWPILAPSARPTPLPTLNRKRLAVDASIWIYQFLKAVRDKEGNALRNSHIVGFFRRICKLLYFGIKPVFVFDGGAPVLKRQTVLGRKKRREGRREDAVRTAGRLLAVQMKKRSEEDQEKKKRDKEREKAGLSRVDDDEEPLPDASEMVYVGEVGMNAQERVSTRKFYKKDAYHLPDLPNDADMGQPNDPRIMSTEELEEYARQFNSGEDVNLYDFSKINFDGEFFMSLPAGDRYNILNAARLKSRLRMGLSKEQLEEMFPDRMAFSKFQIERLQERNNLTTRLMNLNGMNDNLNGVDIGGGRIAGERGREYVLVKNDNAEGGWALGVVSTDKSLGERNKPIDIDALHQKVEENPEGEESEDEFEDIPVEGLNRLPKIKNSGQNMTYDDFQVKGMADHKRLFNQSGGQHGESSRARKPSEDLASLFVDDAQNEAEYPTNTGYDQEEEDLNQAIALSLQKDNEAAGELDEEDHINRAIELSLQKNHRQQESESENEEDFEDVPRPDYEQRAVPEPKPLTNSKSGGSMIAHIVNNRANAAVPKRRATSINSGSDSDMDLQSALAKARKQKAPDKKRQPAPVVQNTKNPFTGPLPFESLGSIFGKKKDAPKAAGDEEEEDEAMAGGFDNNAQEASKPLPPWLAGNGDIRSHYEEQQRKDLELNAEDQERALEEERLFRKENAPIEIESDSESDMEISDAPPAPKTSTTPMGDIAENVRAEPPVSEFPDDRQPSLEPSSAPVEHAESEEEQVDWSESEYGDAVTKPAKSIGAVESADGGADVISAKSKSPSLEFEDVHIESDKGSPAMNKATKSEPIQRVGNAAKSPSPIFEDASGPDPNSEFPSSSTNGPRPSLPIGDSYDQEQAELDAEFDFSDPDDEELLAQLAAEAEEHARFASTLNNKSEKENQISYEQELKQLRNQQKKDRRDADEVSHIMITECQALLRLFGLPYITAPMEAEAQCAELVRLGLVDGIVTDDSDIFLFGGTRVYKNMFNSNKFVECYLASDLEKELSMSRDQLISIAHLLGSDYTEGLQGIGPVTAVEIISEFPTEKGLEKFRDWWAQAQISTLPISSEQTLFRKKFRRAQATKLILPIGFPSAAVTEAYLKPDVDSTPEPFQWGVPDLDRLRDFLMATIGWSQERADEILVPVIRDMNRREQEGTQANITQFFDGTVGVGANTNTKGREPGSKRMKDAVSKLKAKKQTQKLGAMSATWADAAKEWAGRNDLSFTEREQEKLDKRNGKSRGLGKKRAKEVEEAEADTPEATENGNEDVETDDESGSGEEYRNPSAKSKASGRGKGKTTAKRKRVKVS